MPIWQLHNAIHRDHMQVVLAQDNKNLLGQLRRPLLQQIRKQRDLKSNKILKEELYR